MLDRGGGILYVRVVLAIRLLGAGVKQPSIFFVAMLLFTKSMVVTSLHSMHCSSK